MKSLPGREGYFPSSQRYPSHHLRDCLGRKCILKAISSPNSDHPSLLSAHTTVLSGQPPGQDETTVAEGTHFGGSQKSPFSMVCRLVAILSCRQEAAIPCAPKKVLVFALGPCSLLATPVVLRTGILLSQAGVPPLPPTPYPVC